MLKRSASEVASLQTLSLSEVVPKIHQLRYLLPEKILRKLNLTLTKKWMNRDRKAMRSNFYATLIIPTEQAQSEF